jgi:hypothetical protein
VNKNSLLEIGKDVWEGGEARICETQGASWGIFACVVREIRRYKGERREERKID